MNPPPRREPSLLSAAASGFARRAGNLEDNLYCLLTGDSPMALRHCLWCPSDRGGGDFGPLDSDRRSAAARGIVDAFAILDGGWRVYSGLRPHADYYDHLGITSHLPVLIGMGIAGCRSAALAYGPAAFAAAGFTVTWIVARRRFPAFSAFCLAMLTGGLIAGTFPLGDGAGWRCPNYSMQYNRFEWSLLCLLATLIFVERRAAAGRLAAIFDGVARRGACRPAAHGQDHYSAGAILLLVGGLILTRRLGERVYFWLGMAAGCLATIVAYSVYMHGEFASIWRDLAMLRGVQRLDERIIPLECRGNRLAGTLGVVLGRLHTRSPRFRPGSIRCSPQTTG